MNFLLVDDHPLFRLGFSTLCSNLTVPVTFSFATTFAEAVEYTEGSDFDLIFIDLELPDGSGLELLSVFRNKMPSIPCVIISAHTQPELIQNALNAGAFGYISKSEDNNVIKNAIELILSGGMYVPKESVNSVLGSEQAQKSSYDFTPRQLQILQCLALGDSNKDIAKKIFLSDGTVRNYLSNIFEILEVKNRSEAVSVAKAKGILPPWS